MQPTVQQSPEYFMDSKGVYTKTPEGRRYLTPEELKSYDVQQVTPTPPTPLVTKEPLTAGEADTSHRVVNNIFSTFPRLASESIGGAINVGKAIADTDFQVPQPGQWDKPYTGIDNPPYPLNDLLKSALEQKVKDYTTTEGWINNPLQLPVDLLTMLPEGAWTGLIGKGAKTAQGLEAALPNLKAIAKGKILERYGPKASQLELHLKEMNVPKPSTSTDVAAFSKKYGAEPPTAGQMSANPAALSIEAQNRTEVEKILTSQLKATELAAQDWLNLFQPNAATKLSIRGNKTDAGGLMREHIISGFKSELSRFEIQTAQYRDDVVQTLEGINPKLGKELANASSPAVLAKADRIANDMKQLGKPNPTLERQNLFLQQSIEKSNELGSDPLSRFMLHSRNKLRTLLGQASQDPIRWDIVRDPDYTKIINMGTTSKEELARLAAMPGMGTQNAALVLTFKLVDDAKTLEGGIAPLKMYENLTKSNNMQMMATVMTPKQRAGTQVFAHAMKDYSRYDQNMLDRMAFQATQQGTSSGVAMAGAWVPLAFGGSFAQMRAGYAASNWGKLALESQVISKVLLHPDGAWVLARLLNTPKTSPSLAGTTRTLLKIMGQLNIPATFSLPDGQTMTIPAGSVPVQGNPRGITVPNSASQQP